MKPIELQKGDVLGSLFETKKQKEERKRKRQQRLRWNLEREEKRRKTMGEKEFGKKIISKLSKLQENGLIWCLQNQTKQERVDLVKPLFCLSWISL